MKKTSENVGNAQHDIIIIIMKKNQKMICSDIKMNNFYYEDSKENEGNCRK